MDTMAWFREYLDTHQPSGDWSMKTDCVVRGCIRLHAQTGDAGCRAHVIAWADRLIAGNACQPEHAGALFFAYGQTVEDKYRDAIQGVMARLGRDPQDAVLPAGALCAELPFRMAYEMALGGMEKVGLCAGKFRQSYLALRDARTGLISGDLRETALLLLALTDAIDLCADQLYEHWRAMVDIYRATLRGALAAEIPADGETAAMIIAALLAGVRMHLIDPERYLPIAGRRIAALREAGCAHAAAMLEMEGGAL